MCSDCYRQLDIRAEYPAKKVKVLEGKTMEELESIIAEQSKPENLPDWWYDDVHLMSIRGARTD